LWLCGASGAGIFLAKTGLIELPKRMVLQRVGNCSFCGKSRPELFGLVGFAGKDARICDECTGMCFDVLAEETEGRDQRARSLGILSCSFCDRSRHDVRQLIAGPRVFICDGCTREAGGLLAASSWRSDVASPAAVVISMNLAEQTREALAMLTPREVQELRMRYGTG